MTQYQPQLPAQAFSPRSIAGIFPLMVAVAHAIHEQDSTQGALSCLFISDISKQIFEQNPALPEAIFSPCEACSLSELRDNGFTQRYDLAVIVLEPTAVLSEFSDIVVMCRDLSARHCLVFVPSLQNLAAFGFAKVGVLENTDYTAWQFNLFDYKPLPDWFNSRFWANPENWNKFRW